MLIQKAIFFWSEWKPISLYMTSCSDFEVTDVVDSSIGSGAVAICALCDQCHDVELVFRRLLQCQMVDGEIQKQFSRLLLQHRASGCRHSFFHLFKVISNAAQISFIV